MAATSPIGNRISEIRSMLKISQTDLARRMEISSALISYWEAGTRTPSQTQLLEIARHFGVTLEYLLNTQPQPQFQYRAKATLPAPQQAAVGQVQVDAAAQIAVLDSIFTMAKKPLQNFLHMAEFQFAQVSALANHFRDTFKLNRRISLPELKEALSEQGIFVFEWDLPHHVSGLSYRGNITAIFINHLHEPTRRLFTLAHELAHVLFHIGRNKGENGHVSIGSIREPEEKEANAFASEFLMPTEEIKALHDSYGETLRDPVLLDTVARRFNVSREAMFYRFAKLELFKWSEKSRYDTRFTVTEPQDVRVNDIDEQVPAKLIETALALYVGGKVSAGKLAEWFFTTRLEVDDYLFELSETETTQPKHPADPAVASGNDGHSDS